MKYSTFYYNTMFPILFIYFLVSAGYLGVNADASSCSIPTGTKFNSAKYGLAYSSKQGLFPSTAFDGNWNFKEGIQVPDNIRIKIVCNKDVYGDAIHEMTHSLCQNGIWSPALPDCKEYARCRAFPYVRAFASERRTTGRTYSHGKEIIFRCRGSEQLVGNGTIVCEDGKWSPIKFRCEKPHLMCNPPSVEGAAVVDGQSSREKYRNGASVNFECLTGKQLVGDNTLVCNAGNWSDVRFNCVEPPQEYADCGLFPYILAYASERRTAGKTYPNGTEITFRCRGGEYMLGSGTIVCHDGKWSPINFRCHRRHTTSMAPKRTRLDRMCDLPSVAGASLIDGQNTRRFRNGTSVNFECLAGKQLEGDNTLVCIAGNWSEVRFNCVEPPRASPQRGPMPCNLPTGNAYESAKFSVLLSTHRGIFPDKAFDGNESFIPGVSIPDDIHIKITCNSHSAEYNSTCKNGQWSPTLSHCSANRTCSPLTVPGAEVRPETKSEYSDDMVLRFKCKGGKTMTGNDTVVCTNGTWSPVNFTCTSTTEQSAKKRSSRCSKLEIMGAYLRTQRQRFKHETEVNYRCRPKHRLVGDSRLKCKNGGWSEVKFFCLPADMMGCRKCAKQLKSNEKYMRQSNPTF